MERIHVFWPQPAISRLKALAKKTGLPVSEVIRRAIDEYLNICCGRKDYLAAVIDEKAPHG